MNILRDVPLSDHTSFRIGGSAKFFIEARSVGELKEATEFAKKENLPFIILGEGTNVLVSDSDFPGLVIRPLILGAELFSYDNDAVHMIAGAGENWDDVVRRAVERDLPGLENLSWIPGSAGAAPVQNIGAYGVEIKDVLEWVEVFDPKDGVVKKIYKEDCGFGYRDSFFKSPQGRELIITCICLGLRTDSQLNISYKDLREFFSEKTQRGEMPTIAEVRDAVIKIRQRKLPDISKLGTAGSFFKNPIISNSKFTDLQNKFPGLPFFPAGTTEPDNAYKKIPLAWILDKVCGLNGFREGDVGLYETQPLALVNFGKATAHDVEKFAHKISEIVKEKTGIQIEWEVNKINF